MATGALTPACLLPFCASIAASMSGAGLRARQSSSSGVADDHTSRDRAIQAPGGQGGGSTRGPLASTTGVVWGHRVARRAEGCWGVKPYGNCADEMAMPMYTDIALLLVAGLGLSLYTLRRRVRLGRRIAKF